MNESVDSALAHVANNSDSAAVLRGIGTSCPACLKVLAPDTTQPLALFLAA